ncbi:hypothetical protein TVAG_006920 [Trichomonas vaginalis G3]|uniref:Uncharacterized protein n=1 Tax=Trichomonas vaginalis (strain ATCC PRA-98 / G3) TaxID=412133 RepID=A2FC15_TRIV3|nr:FURRY-related family [Trichomonas vaginalis G3]EAX97561.1 hypothetical protein TVAG_006920 [Trichomonas vaginalis G3]KAI5488109.1 FURRY-related family [Trichomonas vaginalis G3]|eukprot:XP_001310491.1 hypothetical protein [Trichomonas vaginalis G3]
MKSTKSILQAYIDNSLLSTTMSMICQEMVSRFPEELNYSTFEKFLTEFWVRDYGLKKYITQIVGISANAFIDTFKLLEIAFPKIHLTDSQDDESVSGHPLLSRLPDEHSKTIWGKLAVNTLIEIVEAMFLSIRLESGNNISDEEKKFMCNQMFSFIDAVRNDANQRFDLIPCKIYAHCLSVLSELRGPGITKEFVTRMSLLLTFSPIEVELFFILFSEIIISEMNNFNSKVLEGYIEAIVKYYKKKEVPPTTIEAMFQCLTNFIGQVLVHNSSLSNSDFIYKANNFTKTYTGQKGYLGYGHQFHAMLYNFSTHKKMAQTFVDYGKKYVDPIIGDVSGGFSAIIQLQQFINGLNYATPYGLQQGVNFSWTLNNKRTDNAFIEYAVKAVLDHHGSFKFAQQELSKFIIQIAVITDKEFINKLNNFLMNPFFVENIEGVCIAIHSLISKDSKYKGDKTEITKMLARQCPSILSTLIENSSVNTNQLYMWQSSLSLCKEYNVGADSVVSKILDSSHPIAFSLQPTKTITQQLNRWQKALHIMNKPEVFTVNDSNLPFTTSDGSVDEALLQLTLIMPELPYESIPVKAMVAGLTSVSPRNAIAIILALEIIAYKYNQFADIINIVFENMIASQNGCSNLGLFITIVLVNHLIEMSFESDIRLTDDTITNVNYIYITGLCASSYAIRSVTLKACKYVLDIKNRSSYNYNILYELIQNNEDRINYDALVTIQNSLDPTLEPDLPEITFNDVITSAYGFIYMFHLAQIAHLLVKGISTESRCGLHLILTRIIKGNLVNGADACLSRNATLIITNSITPDILEKNNLATLMIILHRFSRTREENYASQHGALFSTIALGSCTDILGLNTKDPWSLYSISFAAMRVTSSEEFKQIKEEESKYFPFLLDILDKISNHIYTINFIDTTGNINLKKFDTMPHLNGFISNVLITLRHIAQLYYTNHATNLPGPFELESFLDSNVFQKDKWPPWVCQMLPTPFEQLATDTLSDMTKMLIPDKQLMSVYVSTAKKFSPSILASFLYHDISQLPMYIDESCHPKRQMQSVTYFQAIALMFKPFTSVAQWKKNIMENGQTDSYPELSEAILQKTGSLLAIALAYLANTEVPREVHLRALSLFANVSLGTLAMLVKPKEVNEVLDALDSIKSIISSRHSQLSGGAVCMLSTTLSTTHVFATEQFVSTMFKFIMKWPRIPALSQLISPWIASVSVSPRSQVLKAGDPTFYAFTPLSFIDAVVALPSSPSTFTIVSKIISNQERFTQDILTVLFYRMLFSDASSGEMEQRSAMLHALINTWPERTVDLIGDCLGISGYHYFSKHADDQREFSYIEVIETLLSVLSNVTNILPFHKARILAFILINIDIYTESAAPLIVRFAPNFVQTGEFMEQLIGDIKEVFGLECLRWACCCSDLSLATRGALFYGKTLTPVTTEGILSLTRSLGMAVNMLHEAPTAEDSVTAQNYIEVVTETLSSAVNKLLSNSKPDSALSDLFWLAAMLLQCTEALNIIDHLLKIISALLNDEKTMKEAAITIPSSFNGFISLLARSTFTKTSVTLLVDLLTRLSKYPRLAGDKGALQLALLVPPLEELFPLDDKLFFAELASHMGSDSLDLQKCLTQLASMRSAGAHTQRMKVIEDATKRLNVEAIADVIDIFDQVKIALRRYRYDPVYLACITVANNAKNIKGCHIENIAREAAEDDNPENAPTKNSLLQTINTKGVGIAEKEKEKGNSVPKYVEVQIPERSITSYSFETPESFPPLFAYKPSDAPKGSKFLADTGVSKKSQQLFDNMPLEPFENLDKLIKNMNEYAPELLITGRYDVQYDGAIFVNQFTNYKHNAAEDNTTDGKYFTSVFNLKL